MHKHRPLIDKTPRYMACLEAVLRRAPTTPIVVVVRDPMLVAESWVRLGQPPSAAAEAIQLSNSGLSRVVASGIGIDRVYVVRLDDLTTAPQATLDAIAVWLGHPPRPHDPTMLLGTPEASGRHAPGIDHERGTSSRRADPATRADIERALQTAEPGLAWIHELVTGPLAGSPAP
ncbi:MAG: sulfotransferase [Planctomycetaceae bacterium]